MIIRREALAAVIPATTAEDTRYFMDALCIEPDGRVIATNGHVLLIATDKAPQPDADFPTVPGAAFNGTPEHQTLVKTDVVKSLMAVMPKRSTIPILGSIQVSQNGTPQTATLAATNLQTPCVATVTREADMNFPQYERCIPTTPAAVRVILSADVLETLIKSARAIATKKSAPRITFDIPANGDDGIVAGAIRVSMQGIDVDVTGAAMPMRS